MTYRVHNHSRAPRERISKINTDVAYSSQTGKGYLACMTSNSVWKIEFGLIRNIQKKYALVAEALTFRDGLTTTHNLGLQSVILDSDFINLVRCCTKEINKGEIEHIIRDIRSLKNSFISCGFTWTGREGSKAAHIVADILHLVKLSLGIGLSILH
ncbi:Ribonuclease H superfamily [Sesbania bispinosa]|nr:Ribonuclease H superfamily [Sesbania bispinosa]